MRTVTQVIAALPRPAGRPLPAPSYYGRRKDDGRGDRIGLAVKSMSRHMTDEGWQLFQGLESAGYLLCGHGIEADVPGPFAENWGWGPEGCSDVAEIMEQTVPSVVVLQDKREWLGLTAGGRRGFDHRECFTNVSALRGRGDVFKVAVLKDAHRDGDLQRESAEEMGAHAWVVYYHPRIVTHLAPHVRPEHLIRTWHSLDAGLVPPFDSKDRSGCILSGALGGAYPLRTRLARAAGAKFSKVGWPQETDRLLPGVEVLPHPGYHRNGCATPEYLKTLSRYKVAICTSSVYGYALRKIVEATACGCAVITDLPVDDKLPEIDGNLWRVSSDEPVESIAHLVEHITGHWNLDGIQERFANAAKAWYDFRAVGRRLANDVEAMRRVYAQV